jgi:HEAT repeat protein
MPVPPESVVQPLLVLLQDTDNEVRKAAIEALAATQEHRSNDGSQKSEIRDALLRLIKDDPSPGVRATAVAKIRYISRDTKVINALFDALSDPDVRQQAMESLNYLGHKAAATGSATETPTRAVP